MDSELVIYPDQNKIFYTSLVINHVHSSLANAIRRIMISEIPNIGFRSDQDPNVTDDRDVNILGNTGALHNELIAHRFSMIPLALYKEPGLFITSTYDPKTKTRGYIFKDSQLEFDREAFTYEMKKINNHSQGIVSIYSKDIVKKDGSSVASIIEPDPTLGGDNYILITKLKPNERLYVELKPSIGIGKENSLFSPVGTVAYKFIQDDEEKVKAAFEKKIELINQEREKKSIEMLSSSEIEDLRSDFALLDSKRVYKKNADGDANSFEFQIESNGGLPTLNIIEYSLEVLYHKINDIISVFQKHENSFSILKDDILITRSPTRMVAYDITIPNEDHTLGNLVSKYIQKLYLHSDSSSSTDSNVFEFVSYIKPHPLENKIIFRFQLMPHLLKDSKSDETTIIHYFLETLRYLTKIIGSRSSKDQNENSLYKQLMKQIDQHSLHAHYTEDVVSWISN